MPLWRLSYHILSVNLTAISNDIITIEFDMTLMLSRAKKFHSRMEKVERKRGFETILSTIISSEM